MSAWSALELIHSLIALPVVWQTEIGDQYPPLKDLCLTPHSHIPRSYPCPRQLGRSHRIILRHDGTGAVATCDCHGPYSTDLQLTIEDITPLEVDRSQLGRALCQALFLDSKPDELDLPFTSRIGFWSADAVPAILTLQTDTNVFQSVVVQLVAQFKKPFILLAPTRLHFTAHCQSLLSSVGAAFFPLETTVILTDYGELRPMKPPAELFAQFTPSPERHRV